MVKPAQKQTVAKRKKTILPGKKLPWWKSFLGLLGIGVAAIACVATLVAFNSNTDLRSRAAEGNASLVRTRCNPWLTPPIECSNGYKCVGDTSGRQNELPKKGKWGKCVAIPTPPPGKRCNMTINPPVSCDSGYTCVSDKAEYSGTSSPLLGEWGHCIANPAGKKPTPIPTVRTVRSCWNRVVISGSEYYWPDSCRGNTMTDMVCAQSLIRLTAEEIAQYHAWISQGRPSIPGCVRVTPTPKGE